jgi:putative RecB family exonuclease
VAQGEAQAREEAEGRRLLYVALTRARDHLVISTPICLKKDGAPTRTGVWLDCLLSTSGDALLTADHLTGAAGDWTAAILRDQQPAGAAPSLRALPLLRRHAGAIAGARPLGEVDEEAVQAILRRLDPCPPDLAARTRYSVTELSVYLGCPWRYRLRYVERLAPFEPSTSHPAPGRLRPVEGGLIVHRALQRLGRGIVTDLLADVRAAAHETGLAGHDPEELREVHAMLFRFLGTPTWEAVRTAAELRTEAPILARFDAGLVEGQVDALLRDRTGALHLIDYKTGRAQDAEGRPQHVFQIGVYAAALKAATGQLPATLTIHYLSTNDAVSVPASEAAAARAEAERAMQGIRAAEFPRSGDCDPSTCPYAWVCGP